MMEDIAPFFIGFGLVVVLPIVGLLLNHQRKMAELIHKNTNDDQGLAREVDLLRHEVATLRGQVQDALIKADDVDERLRARD